MLNNNQPVNVVDMTQCRFPTGTEVWHPHYRICKVVAAEGAMRTVVAPTVGQVDLKMETHRVHVNELKSLASLR